MNARYNWIFGLAGLGLALAPQVQAAPNFDHDMIVMARNDRTEEVRQDVREERKVREERRVNRRESETEEPQGYGYGYERRHKQPPEDNSRNRGRR